jgi:hypothetical protein
MSGNVIGTLIGLGFVVCLFLGWGIERMGVGRGKRETESQTMLLLVKVEGLLEEGKVKKALRLVKRYTSHETSIYDISTLTGPQVD